MPTINKPYIKIYHNAPEIKTVGDFIDNDATSIISKFIGREEEFLNYKGDTDKTNRSRILLKFTAEETSDNINTPAAQLPLKVGTELLLPKEEIEISNLYAASIEPYDTSDFNTFVSENLKALLANPSYKSIYSNGKLGNSVDFYPQITVWMWVRSLGEFIDISPFVQQVNTSSEKDGSSFSIVLSPIVAEKSENSWVIKRSSIVNYNSNTIRGNYSADSKLFKLNDKGELKENNFYFHNIVNANDLVFIRYETLELESNKRNKDQERFSVSESDIPNKVYDLIGMVDSSQLTVQPASSEIGINISGRDLTKTIIDDGSYFYIEEFVGNIFANKELSEKLSNRIYGRLASFQTLGKRSIAESINLVINQYSATGYVPEDVFRGYGNRRNQLVREESKAKDQYGDRLQDFKDSALNTIERSRVFYNVPNATDSAGIESAFNTIVSLQESGNLVQDGIFLTQQAEEALDGVLFDVNRIPSNLTIGIEGSAINNTNAYTKYKNSTPPSFVATDLKDGVWQIIDVEVDESVANIRLADTSISEANGSLISTIQSFCEEPFVEFFTDTYGDRFKFIARRPPFNQKAWNELADICESVVIEPEDIISMNLQFDDTDVYSYYILTPQGFIGGASQAYSLSLLPAVVLKEYVDMFGARPYSKVTNYIPYAPKENKNKISIDRVQIINDLKFMIDSTVYLPFTRKGTITINGDRRIKKNTIIYNKMTDELCYVKSVSNNYTKTAQTTDRTTTLQLERCMVKKYVKGKNVDGIENKVSYFNIVNTEIQQRFFSDNSSTNVDILENWDLVRNSDGKAEIFDFFVNKRQFD